LVFVSRDARIIIKLPISAVAFSGPDTQFLQ